MQDTPLHSAAAHHVVDPLEGAPIRREEESKLMEDLDTASEYHWFKQLLASPVTSPVTDHYGCLSFEQLVTVPDYKRFRFRAEVDFLVVRVFLNQTSNGPHIKQWLGISHAYPRDRGDGGAASVFDLRIDNVQRWDDVERLLEQTRCAYGFTADPVIHEIEVAVDAYSLEQDEAQLRLLTERWFRFSKFLCSDNLRLARYKGEGCSTANPTILHGRLKQGFTIVVGNRDDTMRQRFYTKRTDRNEPLPVDQHRSRMEVTLRGEALPFTSMEEARGYRFEQLSHRFGQRKLKASGASQTALWQLVVARNVHLGAEGRYSMRRKFNPATAADSALNGRIRDALRSLTERLRVGSERILRVGSFGNQAHPTGAHVQ